MQANARKYISKDKQIQAKTSKYNKIQAKISKSNKMQAKTSKYKQRQANTSKNKHNTSKSFPVACLRLFFLCFPLLFNDSRSASLPGLIKPPLRRV